MPVEGEPIYAEWSVEAQNALHSQLKMIDPQQEGITRPQLRTFYPYMGWNDIQKGIEALKASGKLQSVISKPTGAKVAFEYFVWKGE
jgi:hypothetical protein